MLFKGYKLFQNLQFKALGYLQKLLEQWYFINSIKGIHSNAVKRW
jgi:hypothetical protein